MSWENGRLLSSLSLPYFDLSFEYNADGVRTSKTVNGTKHTYQVDDTRIISEAYLDYLFVYLYDAAGSPIGYRVRRSSYAEGVFDTYWYEKNLQGDIIAVYNASGTKLAEYTYDAWGNHTVTYYNSGYMTMAPQNPFRYRGYYYDYETGFYSLNSRYYDPEVGRFINADVYISTGKGILGNNMYAYCGNNPVMNVDPYGEAWYNPFSWDWGKIADYAVSVVAGTVAVANGMAAGTTTLALTGSINAALGVGIETAAITNGAINNIVNATYYHLSDNTVQFNEIEDESSHYVSNGYISRWERLDYARQKTEGANYFGNGWLYYSEYSIHMYGWMITKSSYENKNSMLYGIAMSSRYANIVACDIDGREKVKYPTIAYGIVWGG